MTTTTRAPHFFSRELGAFGSYPQDAEAIKASGLPLRVLRELA